MNSNDHILPIYKSPGGSSFDVVRSVRRITGIRKVGHAGTLDPFAEGLLLILTGRRTKDSSRLMALQKEYVGELELGIVTDTFDCTGEVVSRNPVPDLSTTAVQDVLIRFTGEINQLPPMFSAVKFRGKRLYDYARKGLTVPRTPRRVTVYELELLNWESPLLTIRVVCSRGTYVRVLAYDIGDRLGCGAHLRKLVRTRIGSYLATDAPRIHLFEKQWTLSEA